MRTRVLIIALALASLAAAWVYVGQEWVYGPQETVYFPAPQGGIADEPLEEIDENEVPIAWVLDNQGRWDERIGARRLLEDAGFDVRPLPLDQAPTELRGMICFASGASALPEYRPYIDRYGEALRRFVRRRNVIVQLAQAAEVEPRPPFMDEEFAAERHVDDGVAHLAEAEADGQLQATQPSSQPADVWTPYVITAGTRLLEGLPTVEGKLLAWEQAHGGAVRAEPFVNQIGFEVVLALDAEAQRPLMMQASTGRGRVLLSALPWDRMEEYPLPAEPALALGPERGGADAADTSEQIVEQRLAAREALERSFFSNLFNYVRDVRTGRARPLRMTPPPETADFVDGSWSLVALPDTQYYSESYPGTFRLQTDWIARSASRRNIRFVVHLGDIVNRNSRFEWSRARAAMARLDSVVPYAMAPGNHDCGVAGNADTRETLFNEYFPFDEAAGRSSFGGSMEPGRLDNTYHLFEAGGRKWIVMALEWGPRDQTLAWANDVMSEHADRAGILITHAYLNHDGLRQDHTRPALDPEQAQDDPQHNPHDYGTAGGVNDGQQIWDKLVRKHNFALVLSGHVLGGGTGYLSSRNDTGTTTHQILSNYQTRPGGGGGYLRIMEFLPDGQTVRVRTYSPLYDSYLTEPGHQFKFRLGQPPLRRRGGPIPANLPR